MVNKEVLQDMANRINMKIVGRVGLETVREIVDSSETPIASSEIAERILISLFKKEVKANKKDLKQAGHDITSEPFDKDSIVRIQTSSMRDAVNRVSSYAYKLAERGDIKRELFHEVRNVEEWERPGRMPKHAYSKKE